MAADTPRLPGSRERCPRCRRRPGRAHHRSRVPLVRRRARRAGRNHVLFAGGAAERCARDPVSNERRAVPRSVGATVPAAGSAATPSRRGYPSGVDTYSPTYSPGMSSRPEVDRAVPRSERPARARVRTRVKAGFQLRLEATTSTRRRRLFTAAVPIAGYRAGPPDAPESGRAMPRSAPENTGPPAGYGAPDSSRSRPGPERSAPAPNGPPPSSAAPAHPSGPPSGSSGGAHLDRRVAENPARAAAAEYRRDARSPEAGEDRSSFEFRSSRRDCRAVLAGGRIRNRDRGHLCLRR